MDFNEPDFIVEQSGVFFIVLIFDEFVIKIPRKGSKNNLKENHRIMKKMEEIQNHLAEHMNEVLPIRYVEDKGYMIMERAKGERVDLLEKKPPNYKTKIDNIKEKGSKLGYKLDDLCDKNMFYDSDNNQLYFIDLHLVKKRGR